MNKAADSKENAKQKAAPITAPRELTESEKQAQLSFDFAERTYSKKFSQYIVYVDESGDSNLKPDNIDLGYPVFVLALCIFHKRYYADSLVPAVQSLKFNHFGHDMVVFHEKDIRKKTAPFTFPTKEQEKEFMLDLHKLIQESKFVLISGAILKDRMPARHQYNSAYNIALGLCLERLYRFMIEKRQEKLKTFIVFEARGNNEDKNLELEFRRICDGDNVFKIPLPFEILIKSKQTNSTGLQFADLVARPIGRHLIDGDEKENRAFNTLINKLFCQDKRRLGEEYLGHGLATFPPPEKAKGPENRSHNADQGTPQST